MPTFPTTFMRLWLCALALLPLLPATAQPRGPIRLLVGYPPGGPADVTARIVAQSLSQVLEQPVVVENRPGAGGQIAAQMLKAAPADGSVLMVGNTHTFAMLPHTMKNPGFAVPGDFRMLGTIASFELALAVHPKTAAKDLASLGQWYGAHRDEASIGVPAPASAPDFIARKITTTLGTRIEPVPYKGATQMVQDVLSGQLDAGLSGISDFLQHHKAGKLRIVAVSEATSLLPDVPSFTEAGVAVSDASDFQGLYAPAGLSDALVERYNAALNKAIADAPVQEKFAAQAMLPMPGTPQEHALRLARASDMLAELVKESGYQPQ